MNHAAPNPQQLQLPQPQDPDPTDPDQDDQQEDEHHQFQFQIQDNNKPKPPRYAAPWARPQRQKPPNHDTSDELLPILNAPLLNMVNKHKPTKTYLIYTVPHPTTTGPTLT